MTQVWDYLGEGWIVGNSRSSWLCSSVWVEMLSSLRIPLGNI